MGERLFKFQDAHKLEDPERLVWLPVAHVIQAIGVHAGINVADIGAGTGYFAIPLAKAVEPGGKVFAVDLQQEMLTLLGKKLERSDAPNNIELVEGSASETTLDSKCANIVFIANVWHELDDHEAALQEAARVLRPNGRLAILDWRADKNSPPGPPVDHRLAAADVIKFLKKSAWIVAPAIDIGRYSYLVAAHLPR